MDKFFGILNVRHLYEDRNKRKPESNAFNDPNDKRFDSLENTRKLVLKADRRSKQFNSHVYQAESRRPTKYRQYSPTAVTNAMETIRAKEVSIHKASKIYNIPETTLRDQVAEKVDIETVRYRPSTLLTLQEDAKLIIHYYECGKCSKDNHLSRQWYSSFLTRWPVLKLSKPRDLSILRAKSASQETVDKYFSELKTIMYDLVDKPHCIYSVDEKGACSDKTPYKLIAKTGTKPTAVTS
ncbi:hypothetical protein KUTeg_009069 [Tegillarca granosa]|uniref:HTH psq-type domain-containing protein n=1 Tax=Tegillarca granosa TaxID=220873 RepID=A0ABQ9F7S4_TEGGR|nr:hypothetical protein KUTeg_009069 [Tegillarca granosa]